MAMLLQNRINEQTWGGRAGMLPEEGHVQQQHFPAPSSCQAGANRPASRRRRAQPPGRVRQAPLQ